MNIIPTAVANGFTASSSAGIQTFISNIWPILLVLIILTLGFPLIEKLVDIMRHSIGLGDQDYKELKEKVDRVIANK